MVKRDVKLLLQLLTGDKVATRDAAMTMLKSNIGPEVKFALVLILEDKRYPTQSRVMAAYTLGLSGYEPALNTLKRTAENENEKQLLRGFALEALGNLGSPKAITSLSATLFSDSSVRVKKWAAYALSQIRGTRAANVLREAMSGEIPVSLRKEVVLGLRQHHKRFDNVELLEPNHP